jgi:hypothetical protein
LPVQILSDDNHANAHRFHSYDDFEDMELHSTILIDKLGRVHWARNGGEPFSDMAFLAKQVERMNSAVLKYSAKKRPCPEGAHNRPQAASLHHMQPEDYLPNDLFFEY